MLGVVAGHTKTQRERAALDHFLTVSGVDVIAGSVVPLTGEALPDFECSTSAGDKFAIEVTSICAEEIAVLIRNATNGVDGVAWTANPAARILQQKLVKQYRYAKPIDLLCYWDARVVATDDMLLPEMRAALQSTSGPFRRVWYDGEETVYVLRDAVLHQVRADRET